jgi:hypothetical protein
MKGKIIPATGKFQISTVIICVCCRNELFISHFSFVVVYSLVLRLNNIIRYDLSFKTNEQTTNEKRELFISRFSFVVVYSLVLRLNDIIGYNLFSFLQKM